MKYAGFLIVALLLLMIGVMIGGACCPKCGVAGELEARRLGHLAGYHAVDQGNPYADRARGVEYRIGRIEGAAKRASEWRSPQ